MTGPGPSNECSVGIRSVGNPALFWELFQARGKVTGIWSGTAEIARVMHAQGLQFVVPGHDAIWLKAEIARCLCALRAGGASNIRAADST